MIRFVDIRHAETGYRFAFWDTVTDSFVTFAGDQAWDTAGEFLISVYAANQKDIAGRFLGLLPEWTKTGVDDDS